MKYCSFALAAMAPLLSAAAPIESCESISTVYVTGTSPAASTATSFPNSFATGLALAADQSASSAPSVASNTGSSSSSGSSSSGSAIGFASQNGGTTGGEGGEEVTVTSVDELVEAVEGDDPKIIYVEGTLEGTATIRVGSNKSILGKNSDSHIIGAGILIKGVENVIVQNLKVGLVKTEDAEDAIAVDNSSNVWIDHCDLYSDKDNGKDYYDGELIFATFTRLLCA